MSATSVELKDVEEFFYRAMLEKATREGWKDEALTEMSSFSSLPGHREINVVEGPWRCLDRWCSYPDSNKFAGIITIWFGDAPVWVMFYSGEYQTETWELLRHALLANYQEKVFYGCRGPAYFTKEGSSLVYTNDLDLPPQVFGVFHGCEKIRDELTGVELGYCEYQGMSLLP